MGKNCNRCLVRKLKKRNKRLEAVNDELVACCLDVKSDLANAEWATDEHGTTILAEIIDRRLEPLNAAIFAAARLGKGDGS